MPPKRGPPPSPGHPPDEDSDSDARLADIEAQVEDIKSSMQTKEDALAQVEDIKASMQEHMQQMQELMQNMLKTQAKAVKQEEPMKPPASPTQPGLPALPSQTATIADQERKERDDLRKRMRDATKSILGTNPSFQDVTNPSWREQGGIAALLHEVSYAVDKFYVHPHAQTDLVVSCLGGDALSRLREWTRKQSQASRGYVPLAETKTFCLHEFQDNQIERDYEACFTTPARITQKEGDTATDYVARIRAADRLGNNARLPHRMPTGLLIAYALDNVLPRYRTSSLRSRRSHLVTLTDFEVALADIMLDTAQPLQVPPRMHGMFIQHRGQETAIAAADVDDSDSEEPALDTLEAFHGHYGSMVQPYLHRGHYYPTRDSMDRLDSQLNQ